MRRQGVSQNAGVLVVLVGTVLGNFAVSTLLFISLPFLPQVASSRGQSTWMPGVWPTSCLAQLTVAWEPRLPREHTMTVSWPPAGVCWTSRLATATALCPTMTSCMQPAIWREHLLQGKLFLFFFYPLTNGLSVLSLSPGQWNTKVIGLQWKNLTSWTAECHWFIWCQ